MEIEDKKQELLEMDQALKERNWELKQRAAQVGFLNFILMKFSGKILLHGVLDNTFGKMNILWHICSLCTYIF